MDKIEKLYNSDSKDIPLSAFISILYRSYRVYLNREIENLEITAGQIPVLIELLRMKNENIFQDELSDRLCIDKGSVARSLKKIEDLGIIKREILKENRRKYDISLTKKGKRMAPKIKEIDNRWEKLICKELTSIDKGDFKDNLKNLSIKALNLSKYSE